MLYFVFSLLEEYNLTKHYNYRSNKPVIWLNYNIMKNFMEKFV